MNFDKVMQDESLIEDYFFVYIDKFNEIHCGKDLLSIKNNMKRHYDSYPLPKDAPEDFTKSDLIKEIEDIKDDNIDKFEIKIKRPNFLENSFILQSSVRIDSDGMVNVDFIEYNKQRVLKLLKEWNLEKNGKTAPINSTTVSSLHPIITDFLINSIDENIPHYFSKGSLDA